MNIAIVHALPAIVAAAATAAHHQWTITTIAAVLLEVIVRAVTTTAVARLRRASITTIPATVMARLVAARRWMTIRHLVAAPTQTSVMELDHLVVLMVSPILT